MKVFLLKIIAFFTAIWVLQFAITSELPSFWGNEVIHRKFQQMKHYSAEVGTVFIGTSRIHCHIDPNFYDTITRNKFTSYNLGAPGASGLENYRIVEEIIDNSPEHNIRTIYVEMPSFTPPPKKNEHSIKATYFLDFQNLWKTIRFSCEAKTNNLTFVKNILLATKIALINAISLKSIEPKLKIAYSKYITQDTINPDKKKGFSGLKKTIKQKKDLNKRVKIAKQFYKSKVKDTNNEITYLTDEIRDQIQKAKAADINLIYVLMPKLPMKKYIDNYHSFTKLNSQNKLNLSNPKNFPQFYSVKHSSDLAHLNTIGAKLMTKEFAKHYMKYNKN